MKKLSIAVLLTFLVLPFSIFAADSNTATFHNHGDKTKEITVTYTVCQDSNMLGSVPCNTPHTTSLALGGAAPMDTTITIANDNNHYVSVTQITDAASGTVLFSANPAGAYNGCNTANNNNSLSFLLNTDNSMTCVMGEGATKK